VLVVSVPGAECFVDFELDDSVAETLGGQVRARMHSSAAVPAER
jgi:hypothetical protein